MKKLLKNTDLKICDSKKHSGCSDLSGDCSDLSGDCSGLYGNCSGLSGDCSRLSGDCSGLYGDFDACEISPEERAAGVKLRDLTATAERKIK